MSRFGWSGLVITRARRRLIITTNVATITLSLVGWRHFGGWPLLASAATALVGLALAVARPVDERTQP